MSFNLTADEIVTLMNNCNNIRNITPLVSVDHGCSTLVKFLNTQCGIKITSNHNISTQSIKSASTSLCYVETERITEYYYRDDKSLQTEQRYLMNLIQCPTHIDFSSEMVAALRISDGALVVVDCIEGVTVQHETLLRQSIMQRVKPVLFINKLDRIFNELSATTDEIYKNFRNAIESINIISATLRDEKLGNTQVFPKYNNVAFGSGLFGWGFTLNIFAKIYSGKFGFAITKMCRKLWGENYWDSSKRIWVKKNVNGKLIRGFEQFILKPIQILHDAIMNDEYDIYGAIIESLNLGIAKGADDYNIYMNLIVSGYVRNIQKLIITTIIPDAVQYIVGIYYRQLKDMVYFNEISIQKPVERLKLVMRAWLPLDKALLYMMVEHLPSPITSQSYRVDTLYSGPLDSLEAKAIKQCDPNGTLSVYISKMLPTSEKGRYIGFGRVFSGIIRNGQEVRIMGPEYKFGKTKDLFIKKIEKLVDMNGNIPIEIDECPAGSICGVIGIDKYLWRRGTLATSQDMYPFASASNCKELTIFKIAIEPKNPSDLPKVIKGLKWLQRNMYIKCASYDNGQCVVEFNENVGELQAEILLKDWKEYDHDMKGIEIIKSQPIVAFAETILHRTGMNDQYPRICSTKSANRHNKIYMNAEPLDEAFVNAIDDNSINTVLSNDYANRDQFARKLFTNYNWDIGEARKIWSFGCPPDAKANCIVDMTKGVEYLDKVKDHIVNAFMKVTSGGVLCNEKMRGIRFNVKDVGGHGLSIGKLRGAEQIIPCAKRLFYGCQIASGPRLLEPMYLVDISVPERGQSGVWNTLNVKRGEVEKIEERIGTPLIQIQGYVPVIESFGFTELLRKNTGGQAFCKMRLSHWKLVDDDPMKEGSNAYDILMDVRKRKGMKLELPKFEAYYDKL